MRNQHPLHQLRQNPSEWHRRGMTSPAEIEGIVAARIGQHFPVHPIAATPAVEPSYADFFVAA